MPNEVDDVINKDVEESEKRLKTPAEFLATIPNAPSQVTIDAWKEQTPNKRLRLFSPDNKRVYILRAVSGLELAGIQKSLIQTDPVKAEQELQTNVVSKALMWTNTTTGGKLGPDELRMGSAGLPSSLFTLISWLSDFADPEQLQVLSGDL